MSPHKFTLLQHTMVRQATVMDFCASERQLSYSTVVSANDFKAINCTILHNLTCPTLVVNTTLPVTAYATGAIPLRYKTCLSRHSAKAPAFRPLHCHQPF